MKSNLELLNMYKEEKNHVIGRPEVRTGLEDFPTFGEWKAEYVHEYNETHETVSVEEADARFEAEVDSEVDPLEDELVNMVAEMVTENETNPKEESEMTDETNAATVEADANVTETAPAEKPKAKKPAAKKTSGGSKSKAAKPAKKKEPSKADAARKVFTAMYPKVVEGKKARKDVIGAFVEKAGLTPAGAATYYQKMKKAADAGS